MENYVDLKSSFIQPQQSTLKKILSISLTVITTLLIAISLSFCISSLAGRFQNVPPSFWGYNFMQVSSGSMLDSGFDIGEKIIVRAVHADSLKPGDYIAFYVYETKSNTFDINDVTQVTEFKSNLNYKFNLGLFFGIQTDMIREAANSKNSSTIVFHEIIGVYKDSNNELWFKTKGSSNYSADAWYTSEQLVVGVYDNSPISSLIMSLLNFISSLFGLIFIVTIPIIIIAIVIIVKIIKYVRLLFLELDLIEKKKKLTDPICIKTKIGYQIEQQSKIRILAYAENNEKFLYMSLLWKDNLVPASFKQYYEEKQVKLLPFKQIENLKLECNQMYKDGVPFKKISKHYKNEEKKINNLKNI